MPRPFTSLALLRWLTAGVMLFAAVGKTAAPRELHEALAAFDVPAAALWPLVAHSTLPRAGPDPRLWFARRGASP